MTDFVGWCWIVLVMRAERARGQWGINYCALGIFVFEGVFPSIIDIRGRILH